MSASPEQAIPLLGDEAAQLKAAVLRFEDAWRRGPRPRIDDHVPSHDGLRYRLLIELVHIDLELRLKAGEPARVEDYVSRFPEFAGDRAATLELIAAEYALRGRGAAQPSLEEYRQRFPQYRGELSGQIERATLHGSGTTREPLARPGEPRPEGLPAVPGYDILAPLGRGGMGVVYKARQQSLNRLVAVKLLPEEWFGDPLWLERFRREARTASALNHPNICTIYDTGEWAGRPFLSMELIDGENLAALAGRGLPAAEAARLVGQAARALAAAHEAGVVHRDVKPENIMVHADGIIKVLDFGLARRLPTLAQPDVSNKRDTDPGALVGTAAYMSPEQARGGAADRASDVFSLGLVLYQLATGRHAFEADSALGILYAIATQEPVPPSQLNPEVAGPLEALIQSMLHKDPRLRPTAAEVEAALAALPGRSAARPVEAPARLHVRREPELAALHAAYADAELGRCTLVCVAGEPGIGKTTLVEDFLEELKARTPACAIACGHCSERLAGTEAYSPVIDALGNLMRGPANGSAARFLRVMAPTWYAQVAPPAERVSAGTAEASRALSQPAMLREFTQFLREASRLDPVVLFFDDIHWADMPTIDLIAHAGRQGKGLRVLVVLTYRPTELLLGPHPFHNVRLELQGKGVCTELALGFLGRADIERYLALAFPGHAFPADFIDLVRSRTEGNPLFMVDLLRYLRERSVIAESRGRRSLARELPVLGQELPESIRSMIQRKLERVGKEDRGLLAAASVQGHEFDSAVVAGALGLDAAEVEERFQVLDRVHGLVRPLRDYEFPDRTLTLRYAFVHVLYQHALYSDLSPTRRAAFGRRLTQTLRARHGENSPAVAAELALLYEVGRDLARAAEHFCLAARNAARVFAHREAIVLARRGLRLLEAMPQAPARAALELPLQTTLGLQLQVTEGYAAPAAEQAYRRARELYPQAPDAAPLFTILWGLWLFSKVRSDLPQAQVMADELYALARRENDPDLELQAHQALGMTAFCRGEPAAAVRHVEQAVRLYDPGRHRTHAFLFGQDPAVMCKAYGAAALWLLGYPDQARWQSNEAVRMSRDLSPTSQAVALHFAAVVHQLRREPVRARECAEASGSISAEHGLLFWLAGSSVLIGWALVEEGAAEQGTERLRQGLREWRATGSGTYQTYYLGLLAEALRRHGRAEEALRALDEALDLAGQTGEGMYEAELHRLRGETLLSAVSERDAAGVERAAEDFRLALEVARRQKARSLELRAAVSLGRLCQQQGRPAEARALLAECYHVFSEAFTTLDLCEAQALLGAMV